MKINGLLLVCLGGTLLLGLNTATAATYADTVLAENPIVYFRFSDDATVAANAGSLGAAVDGTYNGGAAAGDQAPRPPDFTGFEADNRALQCDGVGGFVSTVSGLMNGRPVFSMTGWIRRETDQANRTGLWGQNDLVEFGYINNGTLEVWTDNGLDIGNAIPNQSWAHVAIVSTGSGGTATMSMYTNGILAGSRLHSLPADNTFGFNIGGGGVFDGTGNFFNGQIDEVAIFDKALTADQVAAQYLSAVAIAPTILQQPQGTNVFEGAEVVLEVKVFGSPPITYQWLYFGSEIKNETNATLVLHNITEAQAGQYLVQVTNPNGTVGSDQVEVTVSPTVAPTITQDPLSITKYAGASGALNVAATGGSHLLYQWQRNQVNVQNATNASLTFIPLQAGNAGDYRVIVSNGAGSVTSAVATITVIVPVPGSHAEQIISYAPIAFWRFNETSGTTAFDFYGTNDATYMGSAAPGPEAPVSPQFPGFESDNLAAQFDGATAYVAGPIGLMNNLNNFSMVGWIRRGGDQPNRTGLFGQNDIVEFGYINNDTLELWTDNGLDVSPNPIPNGEWAQVAVVGEGSPGTARMYVNGSLVGSRAQSLPGPNSFGFNIGGGGVFDGTGNFFNGQIDELAVYNKALTSAQICSLYNRATGKTVSMSISRNGNIILDSKPAGTRHNGASFGATWVESDTDAVALTRDGVMKFAAADGDQITLAPDADFNSAQGTITFWMRSAGTAGGGNFGAMLVDRRSSRGDVIVQADDGSLFVQANDGGGTVNAFNAGSVSDDHWHHIAYVYDQSAAGSTTLYVDGVSVGTQAPTRAWSWDPAQQIELGRSHDG
ncbi:MAG TPA: LamG-like jellyroll fold domain-containing protein, partial [Candidatus Dormibacteraeota bacterium]|nr:LamG-like jellyroll fold domain-containing protein [Candidatus Dormibacteraeota bacterium]